MESNAPHASLRTLPCTLESGLLFFILQPLVGSQFSGRPLLGFSPGWREGQGLSSGPAAPKPRKAVFHRTAFCKHPANQNLCQDSARLPGFTSLSSEPEEFFLFSSLWILSEHCFQCFIQCFKSLSRMADRVPGPPSSGDSSRFPFVSKALHSVAPAHSIPAPRAPSLCPHIHARNFWLLSCGCNFTFGTPSTPVFLLANSYSFLKTQTQHLSLVKPSLVLPYLLIQDSHCDVCLSLHPVLESLLENPL